MKLHQLYESEDRFPALDAFIEATKYYLDLCMKSGVHRLLWHGSYKINESRFLYDFRLREDPRDTPRHVFDAYNNWTEKHYGIQPRRWLFCYPNKSVPSEYGKPSAIFPIGKFEWFKIVGEEDFFISLSQKIRNSSLGEQEAMYEMLHTAKSEGRIIHNTDFEKVMHEFTEETMIFGTKFYAFDRQSLRTVLEQPLQNEELKPYVDFINASIRTG